jgi:hypothetical protein
MLGCAHLYLGEHDEAKGCFEQARDMGMETGRARPSRLIEARERRDPVTGNLGPEEERHRYRDSNPGFRTENPAS